MAQQLDLTIQNFDRGNIHKYQTYKVASVLPVVNNKIQASIVIQMLR